MNRKFRMYFFVPYNISPIQQAIQAGHAALEYAWRYKNSPELENYKSFIENDKTWVILNGGTTNFKQDENGKLLGSLNQIHEDLWGAGIPHSIFHEPDLNDALTAVCFLADDRVWDWENYPDFYGYLFNLTFSLERHPELRYKKLKDFSEEELVANFQSEFKSWNELIGGDKNMFLKKLLKGKKLA